MKTTNIPHCGQLSAMILGGFENSGNIYAETRRRTVFFAVSGLVEHVECNTVRFASSYHFSALFPVALQRFFALSPRESERRAIHFRGSLGTRARGDDGEILIAAGPIYRLLAFPRKEALARPRGRISEAKRRLRRSHDVRFIYSGRVRALIYTSARKLRPKKLRQRRRGRRHRQAEKIRFFYRSTTSESACVQLTNPLESPSTIKS